MLYYPRCDEEEMKGDHFTSEGHCNKLKIFVEQKAEQFNQTADTLHVAIETFNENTVPETAWDSIMPRIQGENENENVQGNLILFEDWMMVIVIPKNEGDVSQNYQAIEA